MCLFKNHILPDCFFETPNELLSDSVRTKDASEDLKRTSDSTYHDVL